MKAPLNTDRLLSDILREAEKFARRKHYTCLPQISALRAKCEAEEVSKPAPKRPIPRYRAFRLSDTHPIDLSQPAFPVLDTQTVNKVVEHARENQWLTRAIDDRRSPFDWIHDHFESWIPGLTQAHLMEADSTLWKELQSQLSDARRGLVIVPAWFNVPNDKDARLLQEPDLKKRAATLKRRERDAEVKAAQRQRPRKKKATELQGSARENSATRPEPSLSRQTQAKPKVG